MSQGTPPTLEWKAKIETFAESEGGTRLGPKRTKVVEFSKSFVAKPPISASSIDVNASYASRSPALDEEALRAAVQRIVYYGNIQESSHSVNERAHRSISQEDIVAMLDGAWVLVGSADWDDDHGTWEYKLAGSDLEGDKLVLKIAVNLELKRITVITKF